MAHIVFQQRAQDLFLEKKICPQWLIWNTKQNVEDAFFFLTFPSSQNNVVYNVNTFKYFRKKKQDLKFWKEQKNDVKILAALHKL